MLDIAQLVYVIIAYRGLQCSCYSLSSIKPQVKLIIAKQLEQNSSPWAVGVRYLQHQVRNTKLHQIRQIGYRGTNGRSRTKRTNSRTPLPIPDFNMLILFQIEKRIDVAMHVYRMRHTIITSRICFKTVISGNYVEALCFPLWCRSDNCFHRSCEFPRCRILREGLHNVKQR